jgi:hypothetical protein
VSECESEASIMRRPWPTRGCCLNGEKKGRLVTGLLHQRHGFNPRPARVGFVMEIMLFGGGRYLISSVFAWHYHSTNVPCSFIHLLSTLYNRINVQIRKNKTKTNEF